MSASSRDLPAPEVLEPAADREQRLAEMVNQLADQCRAGERPDIDSLLRKNPNLADELRGIWATMLVADCVAAGVSSAIGMLARDVERLANRGRAGQRRRWPTTRTTSPLRSAGHRVAGQY